jgi:hypothetical protein
VPFPALIASKPTLACLALAQIWHKAPGDDFESFQSVAQAGSPIFLRIGRSGSKY